MLVSWLFQLIAYNDSCILLTQTCAWVMDGRPKPRRSFLTRTLLDGRLLVRRQCGPDDARLIQ